MPFASDAFSGTAAQELSAYSGLWSKQTGFTGDFNVGVGGQYACNFSSATTACYQHSASPAGADYSVQAEIKRLVGGTYDPAMGVCGRMAAGAQTFYLTYHVDASDETRLYKYVAGAQTLLGTYANALTPGTAQTHELRMTGTTIEAYIDGVQRISVTDSSITAAGKAGIVGFSMREPSVQDTGSIDNWSATDAVSSAFTGGATLGAVVASGSLQSVMSGFTGGATLGAVVAGGSLGATPGVFALGPIKVNGAAQAGAAIDWVRIYSDAGILLYERTGGTLDGSGSTTLTTTVAPPGTAVRIDWQLSGGQRRMPRVTMG